VLSIVGKTGNSTYYSYTYNWHNIIFTYTCPAQTKCLQCRSYIRTVTHPLLIPCIKCAFLCDKVQYSILYPWNVCIYNIYECITNSSFGRNRKLYIIDQLLFSNSRKTKQAFVNTDGTDVIYIERCYFRISCSEWEGRKSGLGASAPVRCPKSRRAV